MATNFHLYINTLSFTVDEKTKMFDCFLKFSLAQQKQLITIAHAGLVPVPGDNLETELGVAEVLLLSAHMALYTESLTHSTLPHC